MKVTSKPEALRHFRISNTSVPRLGKFDSGKYRWTGRAADYVGRDVPDIGGVVAVFPVRRQDQDGPYTQLIAVSAD